VQVIYDNESLARNHDVNKRSTMAAPNSHAQHTGHNLFSLFTFVIISNLRFCVATFRGGVMASQSSPRHPPRAWNILQDFSQQMPFLRHRWIDGHSTQLPHLHTVGVVLLVLRPSPNHESDPYCAHSVPYN
jgi:hypothetical protein